MEKLRWTQVQRQSNTTATVGFGRVGEAGKILVGNSNLWDSDSGGKNRAQNSDFFQNSNFSVNKIRRFLKIALREIPEFFHFGNSDNFVHRKMVS